MAKVVVQYQGGKATTFEGLTKPGLTASDSVYWITDRKAGSEPPVYVGSVPIAIVLHIRIEE